MKSKTKPSSTFSGSFTVIHIHCNKLSFLVLTVFFVVVVLELVVVGACTFCILPISRSPLTYPESFNLISYTIPGILLIRLFDNLLVQSAILFSSTYPEIYNYLLLASLVIVAAIKVVVATIVVVVVVRTKCSLKFHLIFLNLCWRSSRINRHSSNSCNTRLVPFC